MIRSVIAVLSVFALFVPVFAGAAVFEGGEQYALSDGVVITENLYAAGSSVIVGGDVEGDVISAAGKVLITGTVSEDAMLAGGNVDILGPIAEDVRAAAGQLVLGSVVGGEAILFGGTVQVLENSIIGGDLVLGGGEVTFAGDAEQDARLYGEKIVFSGSVRGDVYIAGEQVSIEEGAFIGGTLRYPEGTFITIAEEATIVGEVEVTERIVRDVEEGIVTGLLILAGFFVVTKVLSTLIAALVLGLNFPKFTSGFAELGLSQFWRNLLIGFALLVLAPILGLLLLMTFVGWLLGALLLTTYAILILLSMVYGGILFGALLSKLALKEINTGWKWIFIGMLSLSLVAVVPILGGLLGFVFFLATFGTLVRMAYQKLWKHS